MWWSMLLAPLEHAMHVSEGPSGEGLLSSTSAYICVAEKTPVEAPRQRLIQHI